MSNKRGTVYNRIFTEKDWKEVNVDNKNLLDDFIEEYKQRKMKESTIIQYNSDLKKVLIYIKSHLGNKSILDLNKKDFRRFSLWLSSDLQLSNARVNRMMSSVRSLLTYAEDDDDYEYDNNLAKKVKGLPKEAVRTNEDNFFLTFEQIMKLRQELINRGKLQHAVLLMVMYDSGGRRNEVFQVQKNGLLDGNKTNIVVGKRGKTFPLVYLNDTKELIKQYLIERGEDEIDSLWIIGTGENKKPTTYENIYKRVIYMSNVLSEIESKEIQFFPHSLRHSRIECLLTASDTRIIDEKTGKPKKFSLEEAQVFAHHSDPKTTLDYSKDHTEDIIDNMFNF